MEKKRNKIFGGYKVAKCLKKKQMKKMVKTRKIKDTV